MKTWWKIIAVCFVVAGASFFFGNYWGQNKQAFDSDLNKSTRNGDINFDKNKKDFSRKFASGGAPHEMIKELNDIFFSINTFDEVKPKSYEITAKAAEMMKTVGADDPLYPALVFYQTLSSVVPDLEGILWRLGGIAQKSEYIYYGIIGTLTDIAYNNYMYSQPFDALLEYLVRPVDTAKRFENISDVQDLVITYIIPTIEKNKLPPMEALLKKYPNWNDFTFQYDRAIVAGGIDASSKSSIDKSFSSEGDRYATFTRAYLASAMGYTKNILAGMYLFCAYDLEDVNDFLNLAFHETIKKKISVKGILKKVVLNKETNIKLNTHKDYKDYLKEFPKLFVMYSSGKWSNGSKRDGQAYREKAHKLFIEANDHDLEYVTQMEEQAQVANQDRYIVNAVEMMANERYSVDHYKKVGSVLRGEQSVIDKVTGKSVTMDFSKLFAADFKKDLKEYFPNGFDFQDRKNFKAKMYDRPTFIYTFGRPNKWPDPSFNGFLPEATNENLRELNRRLMFNSDVDYIVGLVLGYVL